ncbi:MAG: hypothetical protein ABIJ18_03895 [archaeon]
MYREIKEYYKSHKRGLNIGFVVGYTLIQVGSFGWCYHKVKSLERQLEECSSNNVREVSSLDGCVEEEIVRNPIKKGILKLKELL